MPRLAATLAPCLGVLPLVACAFAQAACGAPASDAGPGRSLASFAVASPVPDGRRPRDGAAGSSSDGDRARDRCPAGMSEIPVDGGFCIDRWEASLVEVLPSGEERPRSPFRTVDGARVRAVSRRGVIPQGYISAIEAERACAAAGKRLCKVTEWQAACRGPDLRTFGYGERREVGRCNDNGRNPVIALYGRGRWTWETMNRSELNQLSGTLSPTGDHAGCTNGYGVFDMVGNLHEWVADPGGTFYGGYYQDVSSAGHGTGCGYRTTAHEARYHDYATGFRCCADVVSVSSARR